MAQREVVIANPSGLHARPASRFVSTARRFSSDVRLGRKGECEVNAKSIVNVLGLGLAQGEEAVLSAQGEDAQAAVDELSSLVESLDE